MSERRQRNATDMLSTKEAADQAGVTQPTIRRWIHEGLLEAENVAGVWLVDADDLAAFMEEGDDDLDEDDDDADDDDAEEDAEGGDRDEMVENEDEDDEPLEDDDECEDDDEVEPSRRRRV